MLKLRRILRCADRRLLHLHFLWSMRSEHIRLSGVLLLVDAICRSTLVVLNLYKGGTKEEDGFIMLAYRHYLKFCV
jgi:hypothetical protein